MSEESKVSHSNSHSVHEAALNGFQSAETTQKYELGRPGYSNTVVDEILSQTIFNRLKSSSSSSTDNTIHIVDVGSGTGKFTAALSERIKSHWQTLYPSYTFKIMAAEPVEGMRNRFAQVLPEIPILNASASNLDKVLDENSIDLITCAQAFHWFANEESLKQIHRALKPKTGALALVWNDRNMGIEWVRAMDNVIDAYYGPDVPRQQTQAWKKSFESETVKTLFNPTPLACKHWTDQMEQKGGIEMILARVSSISVIGKLSAEEQQKVEEKIKQVLFNHPQTKDLKEYTLPYLTEAHWTFKQ